MLSRAHPQDADLLDRLLDAASAHARAGLGEPVVLRRCSDIEIREEIEGLRFETWCVRKGEEGLVVVATATAYDEGGRECMVASGRFTFSTFVAPSASILTRLARLDYPTK
ncbi:hypothetical protein FHR20_002303 [Sphingomonas leidyi]|uniref:Uncharacterized protein n=1 Tax=Sphingomonas leidyi TaxID=68569 RepID=A0A7X5V0V7_9SPHN|nr:hypothetical protein [Sphingomonas leidyi]NIJ65341.1 hypothetical protein [Sphingomonas leidyi]